jgi:hypothetical protein
LVKTSGIRKIEEKLKDMDENSLRAFALERARDFKTSWVSLGQALHTIWRDKLYREWGYQEFQTYTVKEIGIRKETAMKLLNSYSFLEKDEPAYLQKDYLKESQPAALPGYEAVNALRLVKANKVDGPDYEKFKKDVFEKGREAKEVRKDLTALIREREVIDPEEARQKSRRSVIRRLVGALAAVKKDAEILNVLPQDVVKDTEKLIARLEKELE